VSEIVGDFGVLRAEAELIDVTSSLPYADEAWTYTDQAGHRHRYSKGYPTLTWVIDETYWCEDCNDEHTEGHWECPLCGERITPGLKGPDMFPKRIPGMVTYYLNDVPISKDEYQRLVAQITQRGGQ
jgi:hypothetical protein